MHSDDQRLPKLSPIPTENCFAKFNARQSYCITVCRSLYARDFIGEDDFREVYREVINIKSNYYQFGIELGLPFRDMGAIKKAFSQDVLQAFTEVLGIWLRHSYDVKKYGPPTWRRLVEAVGSPAGGDSHALAKKIAENHPVSRAIENPASMATFIVKTTHTEKHEHACTLVKKRAESRDRGNYHAQNTSSASKVTCVGETLEMAGTSAKYQHSRGTYFLHLVCVYHKLWPSGNPG